MIEERAEGLVCLSGQGSEARQVLKRLGPDPPAG
jgi:hypothetical protein